MSAILVPSVIWLIVLLPIGVLIWLIRRVRRGTLTKGRATLQFFFYSASPIVAYVSIFFALVAIEEMTDIALITEGYARSLLLIGGIGFAWVLLMTAVYGVVVLFVNRTKT